MSSQATTNIDQLHYMQQQRLVRSLALLNETKKNLEDAIALTELREREYRELSEDVQRKLDAINLVASMTKELNGTGEDRSVLTAPPGGNLKQSLTAPHKPDASLAPESTGKIPVPAAAARDSGAARAGRSSRPLFSFNQLSAISRLAITK